MTDGAALTIPFEQFAGVDIRVGTVVAVEPFPEARRPALKLTVDFGPVVGAKRSSAQITHHYAGVDLVGRRVLAVVNLAPRRIGPFLSEVLVLGVPDADGHVATVVVHQPSTIRSTARSAASDRVGSTAPG